MAGLTREFHRDESLYNMVQENELFLLLEYLPMAAWWVAKNRNLWRGVGRPPKDLYDILVCLTIQQYFGKSLRRSMGIIRMVAKFAGWDISIPCFKTLDNYLNNPDVEYMLDELIEITSNPLRLVETAFATDSTGVSTLNFSSWYSIRCKKRLRRRDHVKAHLTTTIKLNSVACVDVTEPTVGDSTPFKEHVRQVAKNFLVREWSADAAYLARKNCDAVAEVGGEPWFMIKSNTTPRAAGSSAWKGMVNTFKNDPETAEGKYHKRSNVESTISAKKRKFGSSVRSKEITSQVNEEKSKWVGYNFTVLNRAYFEHDIIPDFMK